MLRKSGCRIERSYIPKARAGKAKRNHSSCIDNLLDSQSSRPCTQLL